ncbi:MAG: MFS transporter [Acidimicrobiales bacterium]|nr:MFS transporter [Acidimicrobiales bacterium]
MADTTTAHGNTGVVLAALAASQFVMTLDSSVMNVSIATVAEDVGTTVTGVQTAITMYTLVMASMMITGGKLGAILGRRRALGIGLVVYAAGSLTTAFAPNLGVLLFGWSLLEGLGAALIMPAIVALVATNFPPERRSGAYGAVAAAGAAAVAVGPLIGGAVTTYFSWRYVFVGEVAIVLGVLALLRRIKDQPPTPAKLDVVGAVLSALGLGLLVFGVLRSGDWNWVVPGPNDPSILGASPVIWLIAGGLLVLWLLFRWEERVLARGGEPLVRFAMLQNRRLTAGLSMFFAIPLFLSVVLELSALETGMRIFPLSVSLLVCAIGIPKVAPRANPRLVVRIGVLLMLAGILTMLGGLDPGANAGIVAVPMLLLGAGLGALASQVGGVTVSAAPDSESAEVGGLQNTATNLGASLGTALIGSILLSTLAGSATAALQNNPDVPPEVLAVAEVELANDVQFVSQTQLREALEQTDLDAASQQAILDANEEARIAALRTAFAAAALLTIGALFLTGGIPVHAPGSEPRDEDERADAPAGAGG